MELTVTCGSTVHRFALPPGTSLVSSWSPADTGLDARIFVWPVGPDAWDCRLRISNDSVVIGHPEKTKPRIQAPIDLEADDGFEAHPERPFPEDYPMGRGAWRRVQIRRGSQRLPGIAFRSDWRQRSSKYGPCNMPLPRFGDQQRTAMLQRDGASLRAVYGALSYPAPFHVEDGDDGVFSYPLGFAPHGPSDIGAPAGSGIYFQTGYRQSKPDLQRAFLLAQCEGDRARFWVERETGEPVSTEHYPGVTPDTWGYSAIPEALPLLQSVQLSGGDPLPLPYDPAHSIRGFRRTAQVAEQAGDPMCAFMVHALANEQRLRFSHRGRLGGPGYYPMNLAALMHYAEPPHTGVYGSIAGRQLGWPFFLVAYDAKLSDWRGEMLDWAGAAIAFIEEATTPTGPIQKSKGGSGGWPTSDFSCQVFEQVILAYGVTALATQMSVARPIFVDRVLENIYGPETLLPILGSAGYRGPSHYVRTADDNGNPVERLKDGLTTYGDPTHAEAACALAAHLDPHPETWMDRWNLYGTTGFTAWKEKLEWATSLAAPDNLAWLSPGMGVAQKLATEPYDA